MLIEAERSVENATTQLVRYHFIEPPDNPLFRDNIYRLELSLSPRPLNSRACYADSWRSDRFEPIGSIFLVPPERALHAKSDSAGKARVILCQLQPEMLHQWLETDLEWDDNRLTACLDIRNPNIRQLMLRLADEVKHPGFASDAYIELLTGQLGIELGRFCNVIPATPDRGGLSPWRLRLIDQRLREGNAAPSLTELSDICGLSVRQLARAFKISRGCSIGAYIANHRMERARNLLAGEDSIKRIASSLGFSSPASFCYAFRRATGLTPGEFRKKLL